MAFVPALNLRFNLLSLLAQIACVFQKSLQQLAEVTGKLILGILKDARYAWLDLLGPLRDDDTELR